MLRIQRLSRPSHVIRACSHPLVSRLPARVGVLVPVSLMVSLLRLRPTRRAFAATVLVLLESACAHTRYDCSPPDQPPNRDSLTFASGGPLRRIFNDSGPESMLVGNVVEADRPRPVVGAHVRFRSDTTDELRTDSTGTFRVRWPEDARAILEIRAIGYYSRHDTLDLARLRGQRLVFPLADTWIFGDVQSVPVCTPVRKRWPSYSRVRARAHEVRAR